MPASFHGPSSTTSWVLLLATKPIAGEKHMARLGIMPMAEITAGTGGGNARQGVQHGAPSAGDGYKGLVWHTIVTY